MRKFLAAIVLLALTIGAQAQSLNVVGAPPYAGSAVSATGYNLNTGGTLFLHAASDLQFGLPFSVVMGIKGNSTALSTTSPNQNLIDTRAGTFSQVIGWYIANCPGCFTEDSSFAFQLSPGSTAAHCYQSGVNCLRPGLINDGAWHSLCWVETAANSTLYVDGVRTDLYNVPSIMNPQTSYWSLGNTGAANQSIQVRETGIWNRALTPAECVLAANLNAFGKTFINNSTDAPSLQSGMVDGWTFGNCNGSGCAAVVGTDNWIYDTAPSTCSVTAPSNGATGLTGNVSVTASTTDVVGISSVSYYVDNYLLGTSTTGPSFSVTWATTGANKVADGSHSIYAICTNVAGNTLQSSTITASTSNGVGNHTWYVSSAAGASDSNDCQHQTFTSGTSGPCLTLAGINTKINATPLLGGDSILGVSGSTITTSSGTLANVLTLIGPSPPSPFGSQNLYPGKTITIGTTSACTPLTGTTTNCITDTLGTNSWTADGGTRRIGMITGINVSNVTVQGWILSANGMSAALCDTCGWGITFGAANGQQVSGNLIQNNQVIGFTNGIWQSNTYTYAYTSSGQFCGVTIQDNIVNGTTSTSIGESGVVLQGGQCTPSAVSSSAISNYVYNLGHNASASVVLGGVLFLNGSYNTVDKFNVTGVLGANSHTCGSLYGNWWYQVSVASVIGNEVYRDLPTAAVGTPCDTGGFDADIGTFNLTIAYNYAHNNWGPAMTILNGTGGGINSGGRVIRYNIFEDSWLSNVVGNGFSGQTNPDYVYNNTVYNGYNGQTDPYFSGVRSVFAYGTSYCPVTGSYNADNIFASAGSQANLISLQDNNGTHSDCNPQLTWRNNDYWAINSGTLWWAGSTTYTTLVNWETASGETNAITSNPNFAGTVGNDTICYSGTGIPAQPGLTPCPSSYKLTTGSPALDVGISDSFLPAQWGTAATADFYNATVPQVGHGSGYNAGADGAFH